jgi:hypothetical protein
MCARCSIQIRADSMKVGRDECASNTPNLAC